MMKEGELDRRRRRKGETRTGERGTEQAEKDDKQVGKT